MDVKARRKVITLPCRTANRRAHAQNHVTTARSFYEKMAGMKQERRCRRRFIVFVIAEMVLTATQGGRQRYLHFSSLNYHYRRVYTQHMLILLPDNRPDEDGAKRHAAPARYTGVLIEPHVLTLVAALAPTSAAASPEQKR